MAKKPAPMTMSETITKLEALFDKLNKHYFEGKLHSMTLNLLMTRATEFARSYQLAIWDSAKTA